MFFFKHSICNLFFVHTETPLSDHEGDIFEKLKPVLKPNSNQISCFYFQLRKRTNAVLGHLQKVVRVTFRVLMAVQNYWRIHVIILELPTVDLKEKHFSSKKTTEEMSFFVTLGPSSYNLGLNIAQFLFEIIFIHQIFISISQSTFFSVSKPATGRSRPRFNLHHWQCF